MEKKVYEGYKRTSTSKKIATANSSAAKIPSVTKKAASQKVTAQKKRTSKANAKPAGKTNTTKPRLAMFIDIDNVGISRENLLEILFYTNGKYQIELCKLYGFSDETLPGVRDIASEYNVVTVGKMKFKQNGVNCLDSRLLIDAYECALNNKNKIDMIFLWCYPCDLADLFEKIVGLGINTATIDNNLFDCKNKFVSQAFKLYSPYHFDFGQSTYGKVQNEPANIAPNDNIEAIPTSNTATPSLSTETNPSSQPMIDGVIPPVLPRRTIVERSNPNAPKPEPKPEPEPETNPDEVNAKPTSLVEEIARKLNLQISDDDEFPDEPETKQNPAANADDMFMDMLKKAGLDDLMNEKILKYEDTIGDL